MNGCIERGDFETAEAQKACTRQEYRIMTRVTKSSVCGYRPKITSRVRAGNGREEGGGEKIVIDLYVILGPPASSLKA